MSGLPSWSESRQQMERFEEQHGPVMSEHEARSFVRGPQVTAMLRRAGIEIPEAPADALLRLCANFSQVVVEADYAWRQAALMRVSDDRVAVEEFDEVMNAVSATSLIAPHLADAQVVLVDVEQIGALPDWPSREQALLALCDARLPFEVTFIDIRAKLSGLSADPDGPPRQPRCRSVRGAVGRSAAGAGGRWRRGGRAGGDDPSRPAGGAVLPGCGSVPARASARPAGARRGVDGGRRGRRAGGDVWCAARWWQRGDPVADVPGFHDR